MLKKTIFPLLLLWLLAPSLGAQPQTVVKLNPLSLAITTLNLQAERALNERFSFQLGLFLGRSRAKAQETWVQGPIRYGNFGITPELRYHATFARQDCPEGLYLAPYLRYRRMRKRYNSVLLNPPPDADRVDIDRVLHTFGGGMLLGYEFITDAGFVADIFIGPQFSLAGGRMDNVVSCPDCTGGEDYALAGFDFNGLEIRAGIALGYAF